ncbi:MAG TPA: hypothetical protein V6D23_15045 [Candidatus Obscuribacterales bacterium]
MDGLTMLAPDSLRLARKVLLQDPPGISSLAWTPDGLYALADNLPVLYRFELASLTVDWRLSLDPEGAMAPIPKPLKPDFEASVLIEREGRRYLQAFGSGSLAGTRELQVSVELASGKIDRTSLASLYAEIGRTIGLEVNIEAAAMLGDTLLLGNRGHHGQPANHLLSIVSGSIRRVQRLELPREPFAGLSGLEYEPDADRLWLTATTEATASVYDDGAIGDSYLAWIDDFSRRFKLDTLFPTGQLNLTQLDPAFDGQKIEGLALCPDGIWLGSDNDSSEAGLFELCQS